MFQEQVTAISDWFVEWTEPEQMVLLYSLLKRLSPLQVKLLSRVVDQHVTDCAELQVFEHQANNPVIISNLLTKRKEIAMQQLLLLLPLLRPGNNEAKSRYLKVIPAVLSYAVETGEHLSEAKQLISYSLIHPALLSQDRKQLTPWVQVLKARFNSTTSTQMLPLAESLATPPPPIANPAPPPQSATAWRQKESNRVRRSNSLTPPVSLCQSSVELWTGQDELCTKQKPRSFSLSEHVPPLSPQSSQASSGSGSETQLDETKTFATDSPGMRDVGSWLKQLRLHKYMWLFSQLSYDDMLSLSEEKLETLGVTKGARHKIILSVRKLRDRHLALCQLEKDVNRGANLMTVLEELKIILCSPIKGTAAGIGAPMSSLASHATNETAQKTDPDDEDIPNQLTKVLGKACTHLIVNNGRDEESLRLSLWLLDKCLAHEAFVPHRRRLETWRLQIHALWQQHNHRQNRWHHHAGAGSHHHLTDTRSLRRPTASFQNRPTYLLSGGMLANAQKQQQGYETANGSAPSLSGPYQPPLPHVSNGSAPDLLTPLPVNAIGNCACGPPIHFPTPSQPSLARILTGERVDRATHETDINSTLEDLCLSMAEHFLEGVS